MQNKIVPYLFIFSLIAVVFTACQDEYVDPATEGSDYVGTRSAVKIRGIMLTDFPATDPLGNTWDSIFGTDTAGRPDIFYSLHDEPDTNGYPAFTQLFQFEDVDRDSVIADSLTYTLNNEYQVRAFGSNIRFDIYDYEKDPINAKFDSTLMKTFIFSITPGDTTIKDPKPYPDGIILNEDGYNAIILLDWIK